MASSTELRQERLALHNRAQEMLALAESENRDFTTEEDTNWLALHNDSEALTRRIERQEQLERTAATNGQAPGTPAERPSVEQSATEQEERATEYRETFRTWLRQGPGALNPEQQRLMASRYEALSAEQRAQSTVLGTAGGYFVPEGFYGQVESATKFYGGMRNVSFTFQTTTGQDLPIPTDDDTSNVAAVIGENTQVTNQDVALGQVVLRAYMYTSKLVLVSLQLLQDSAFDIEGWLAQKLGERMGRGQNADFTSGAGANSPQGIVTTATNGKTAAAAGAIAWPELIDLEHSVDPSYRVRGRWMFHDLTLAALKKLTDGEGRYLWQPGLPMAGTPNMLMGYQYQVNNDMPQLATGNRTVLFGDFSKYFIRDVRGFQLMQLRERYADYFQVGFLGFARCDGKLIDAGQHPVKCLTQA